MWNHCHAQFLAIGTVLAVAALAPENSIAPFASAEPLVEQARDAQDAIHDAVGLRFSVTESIVRRNIISTRTPYGFKIKSIDPGSAAERAALKRGDVLLRWNGQPIKSLQQLKKWIERSEPGGKVPIVFARLKEERSLLDRHPWVDHDGKIELPR